jgi:hypothetical protein
MYTYHFSFWAIRTICKLFMIMYKYYTVYTITSEHFLPPPPFLAIKQAWTFVLVDIFLFHI